MIPPVESVAEIGSTAGLGADDAGGASVLGDSSEPSAVAGHDMVRTRTFGAMLADLVALTKPRVTGLVVATMLGGAWVAARHLQQQGSASVPGIRQIAPALLGTVLIVGGANALNMVLERDTDGRMERTKNRPLPAGRLSPEVAFGFGLALSLAAAGVLALGSNVATGVLAVFALLTYVAVYTPLKRRTTLALLVGAVPGAIPPLLGWTAVTGRVTVPGLVLFGILFFWQVPHFLAIATFRSADYRRAGLKVLPVERGDRFTRRRIVVYLVLLMASSFTPWLLGMAGAGYLVCAVVLGLGFLAVAAAGLRPDAGTRWAKWLFAVSIVYLVLLHAALMSGV